MSTWIGILISLLICGGGSGKEGPWTEVLLQYQKIQMALSEDALKDAGEKAAALANLADKIRRKSSSKHLSVIRQASAELSKAKDDKAYRVGFEKLSQTVIKILKEDTDLRKEWRLYYCPMYSGFNHWVQHKQSEGLKNPYWGKKMLECGAEASWTEKKASK